MSKCKGCNVSGSHVRLLNKCSECDQVYINQLLHYATYHYSTSSKDNIRKVIQEEFDHQDIKDVKKDISDLGVEVEKADGIRIPPNRTALEADVADLMTGLENMDLMQDLKPKFTALDWSNVPLVTLEVLVILYILLLDFPM